MNVLADSTVVSWGCPTVSLGYSEGWPLKNTCSDLQRTTFLSVVYYVRLKLTTVGQKYYAELFKKIKSDSDTPKALSLTRASPAMASQSLVDWHHELCLLHTAWPTAVCIVPTPMPPQWPVSLLSTGIMNCACCTQHDPLLFALSPLQCPMQLSASQRSPLQCALWLFTLFAASVYTTKIVLLLMITNVTSPFGNCNDQQCH